MIVILFIFVLLANVLVGTSGQTTNYCDSYIKCVELSGQQEAECRKLRADEVANAPECRKELQEMQKQVFELHDKEEKSRMDCLRENKAAVNISTMPQKVLDKCAAAAALPVLNQSIETFTLPLGDKRDQQLVQLDCRKAILKRRPYCADLAKCCRIKTCNAQNKDKTAELRKTAKDLRQQMKAKRQNCKGPNGKGPNNKGKDQNNQGPRGRG